MYIRDYVKATYEAIAEKGDTEKTLHALSAYLKRRGLSALYPGILRGLAEEVRRREKTTKPILRVARESDISKFKDGIDAAFAELGASGEPELEVNDNLIGGFIAEAEGKRIDRSFKTKLLHAYQRLTAGT